MWLAQAVHNTLAPELKRLLQQLLAPITPVPQCLVVGKRRGRTRHAVQPLVASIHIAQTAGVGVVIKHVVPGRLGASEVGQRAADMNIGYQPRRPVELGGHAAQKIRRVLHHPFRNKSGQRHHTAPCQPALRALAAMVVGVDLHALFAFGDSQHRAIGDDLGMAQPVHQLGGQPAIALGPGQHLVAVLAGVVFVEAVRQRPWRAKAVTAGKVMHAGPGRDPVNPGAKIVAAAVVQIPQQALVLNAVGSQPAGEQLLIECRMGRRQAGCLFPDANGWHGVVRGLGLALHQVGKALVLLQRFMLHALHGQQAFMPGALPVQAFLRAVAQRGFFILPAPSHAPAQAQLLQQVLHLVCIVAGHGQIVGAQRAGHALHQATAAVAAHTLLRVEQRGALHSSQLQRPRCGQPGHAAASNQHRHAVYRCGCGQVQPLGQPLPLRAQRMAALQCFAGKTAGQVFNFGQRWRAGRQQRQRRHASCTRSRAAQPLAPGQWAVWAHRCVRNGPA